MLIRQGSQGMFQHRIGSVIVKLHDLCGTEYIGITVLPHIDIIVRKYALRQFRRIFHPFFGMRRQKFRIADVFDTQVDTVLSACRILLIEPILRQPKGHSLADRIRRLRPV